MKFSKMPDMTFKLSGTVADVTKVRDELATAWDESDETVVGLTEVIGGRDDDSQDEVEFIFDVPAVPDMADVLSGSDDPELREAGDEIQEAIDAHNSDALDAAESAAE